MVTYDPGKVVFMCVSGAAAEAVVRSESFVPETTVGHKGREDVDIRMKFWAVGEYGTVLSFWDTLGRIQEYNQ